ncbi:MAG TPA: glycosyltransferase family 39 protein [Azospirillum sp.]|nr:glycosyltransferase family 39 protein [Azospirillum sp.]
MFDSAHGQPAPRIVVRSVPGFTDRHLLWLILLVAAAVRLPGVFHDLPFSYTGDELHLVKRAMAMGTGDLNPHWFNKPALLMYMLTVCYGLYFAAGWLLGVFPSVDAFAAHFLSDLGPFLLIGRLLVAAFGLGTAWVVFLIGRRVYGTLAGLAAALVFALLMPAVIGAQIIKEDLPCGFFLAASVYWYLKSRDSRSVWPLLAAAALAGLSAATKYYGAVLLPVYALAELSGRSRFARPEALRRVGLTGLVAFAAFFAGSPYHVLDPTFAQWVLGKLGQFSGGSGELAYNPDRRLHYVPGFASVPTALAHFLLVLAEEHALGVPLSLLALLGTVGGLAGRETRVATAVVAAPVAIFALTSATLAPFHAAHRHLNGVYPLLCVLVAPGALLLARFVPFRHRTAAAALVVLTVAAVQVPGVIARDLWITRMDSRTAAYLWIVRNLPRDARILADDTGPVLQPNRAAVDRLRARLAGLPAGDTFTHYERLRLDLLSRFTPADGFDVEVLGHQWWLPREVSADELRSRPQHRRMGNPLVTRVAQPLDDYRRAGFRYVVTTGHARDLYLVSGRGEAFPSFERFFRELDTLVPILEIDPATDRTKGPVVRIYDLEQGEPQGDAR